MKRAAPLLASLVLLTACPLERLDDLAEPSVEETYRAMTGALTAATEAVRLLPAVPAGPPTFGECRGGFGEETGDVDVTYDLWIPYETAEERAQVTAAVAEAWRGRGLEVSPFGTDLTVFPNGGRFRLDLEDRPDLGTYRLHGQTSCLPPATGIPPQEIAGLGGDPRDLRGPVSSPGATTQTAVHWMSRVFEATIGEAQPEATSHPLRAGDPIPCYRFEPDLVGVRHDVAVEAEPVGPAIAQVAEAWEDRGFEVRRGSFAGSSSVLARFGDFSLRARADERRGLVILHGIGPCLPEP